ncbi:MAG: hypothetical protein EBR06_05295 [Acidimicrobiia bacterium]|nr:hypothetical protein [Acidimicrobiia bacterium]
MVRPFIPSSKNTSIPKDDYYTTPDVFERLGLHFDLDVCAPKGGVSWIPADRHYSIEDDGLAQPWSGRVWMNPPYSNPTPWMARFLAHGDGVCLVPVSRGRWYAEAWDRLDAVTLCPLQIGFVKPSGQKAKVFMPTFFGALGTSNVQALRNFERRVR